MVLVIYSKAAVTELDCDAPACASSLVVTSVRCLLEVLAFVAVTCSYFANAAIVRRVVPDAFRPPQRSAMAPNYMRRLVSVYAGREHAWYPVLLALSLPPTRSWKSSQDTMVRSQAMFL